MEQKAKALVGGIKKNYFIAVTLFPAILVLGGFVYWPAIHSFYLSLFRTRLFTAVEFIGFQHYVSVLTDPIFWIGVRNTVYYAFFAIIGGLVIGLMMAMILHGSMRFKGFFRTVFFAPYIIPMAAYTLLWWWIFDPRYGLVNIMLAWIGIDPIPWLTSREWVLHAFILMTIWKRAGFHMVLFSSGLSTIPGELYEASLVDGANTVRRFFHITLPMLRPVTLFSVIMAFLHTFQLFTEPYVITRGGPGHASTTIVYQIYNESFQRMNIGRASAMATILFIMILLFTWLIMRKFDLKEL
ncbi:MAG: sugar ABC transporter permease [Oscillospiraceae bacterium]|nr:sugar ABC transporter permease [Oscillospiraceae bacterium]